ncbi:hypothetical protein M0R45_030824 [Rubus argutus]|uniref:Uncharacterized protein n=1 Tax=Rubus argutus TaxID=59490 RepID=A0AAW1WCA8_RUBAR
MNFLTPLPFIRPTFADNEFECDCGGARQQPLNQWSSHGRSRSGLDMMRGPVQYCSAQNSGYLPTVVISSSLPPHR